MPGNVFDAGRDLFFGHTDTPAAVFEGQDFNELSAFFKRGFQSDTLEDPRLVRFLDRANREIDRTLKGAQQNFERSLGPNQRASGDAAAFERDLAIAGSEGKSAAFTDIVKIFEDMKLEHASGALALLTAQSQERLGRAGFELEERLGTLRATEDFFGGRGSEFASVIGSAQ